MTTGFDGTGASALRRHAPDVADAIDALVALNPPTTGEPLAALARATCANALSLPPLPVPDTGEFDASTLSDGGRAALEFAEQMSVDVSAIDDPMRSVLFAALGDRSAAFVTSVYVADWTPRLRGVLDRLFGAGEDDWTAPAHWNESPTDTWPLVDAFITRVAGLRELDPVTSELVRLRAARQHNCRICKSLRNRSALAAGADESTFDAIDDHASSAALSDRHKAALALVDAMVWQPGFIGGEVIDAIRVHFSPAQAVELVVAMMRNATNKIAVATGADAANVSDGVEIYEINRDGSMAFGLTDPR